MSTGDTGDTVQMTFLDAAGKACRFTEGRTPEGDPLIIFGKVGEEIYVTQEQAAMFAPFVMQFAQHGQLKPTAQQEQQQREFMQKVSLMRQTFLREGRHAPFTATPSDLQRHGLAPFPGTILEITCGTSSLVLT